MVESEKKKKFEYEFGGPVGTTLNVVLLPVIVLCLAHWSDIGFVDLSFLEQFAQGDKPFWQKFLASPVFCPSCRREDDDGFHALYACTAIALGWFLFQVFLERFLPCELVEGAPIHGDAKNRLVYRINGHLAFWITLFVTQFGFPFWHEESQSVQFQSFPLEDWLYQFFAEFAFVTIILTTALSVYLYVDSFVGDKILAHGGNSGVPMYDFFMGRELNPRIGNFDWKEFCELRPGLIAWMLLNIAALRQQYNSLGYVTGSMLLVNIFQGSYVWDALYQERSILTTMDITTDGFGYMLAFGDMAWVPFTYSIQARYLVKNDPHLSYLALAGILGLHIVGYSIFRGANGQKDAFRRDPGNPKLSHLNFLQTKRGTKLLTSGWWGMARKINYTGDWIMGLTWCLVCGFDSIVPYFYAIYFAILLFHRSMRDDQLCQEKYGQDWDTYKKIVPYKFIPGVV
mmetsp:Transcript_38938/g.80849  ORF Transcript_38938/g.80849 Transcript_38938/m.80849 type:complete len:456 (-) Transcript_38938:210-1577(-)